MFRTYRHLIAFVMIFTGLFASQQIFAENTFTNDWLQKNMDNAKPVNSGGFIFDIQKIDPVLLAEDVEKMRGFFIRRQHELAKQMKSKQLNSDDAIITLIMPGGLLYAGYRKHEFEQAKGALLTVTAEIKELSNDLVALQGQDTANPLLLAQLP